MLPQDPRWSGQAVSAKIIPLRREGEDHRMRTVARAPTPAGTSRARRTREDAARHFLKFMLPGIPVTAFVMSFLYGYLLLGMHSVVLNGRPAEATYTPTVDPTLPLIGALLLAFATGMLCIAIYFGFLRISERGSGED